MDAADDVAVLQCWASCTTSLEDEAALEVTAVLKPSRPVKALQGQVLFTLPAAVSAEAVAAGLLKLRAVDYVHVLLVSTKLSAACADGADGSNRGLNVIRSACSAINPEAISRAIRLWRALGAAAGDARVEAAAGLSQRDLVFRARGKRGGRGHGFSSDEAKRAAAVGFGAASGMGGSTREFHVDVLAQVHDNNFWLGLRLNSSPLSDRLSDAAARGADFCLRAGGATGLPSSDDDEALLEAAAAADDDNEQPASLLPLSPPSSASTVALTLASCLAAYLSESMCVS